jgi:hypothetical protein
MTLCAFFVKDVALAAPKPPSTSVRWMGNGTLSDGASRTLVTEICSPTIGANSEGNYLRFVLASTKAFQTLPKIKFGAEGPELPMYKSNNDKRGTSSYWYVVENGTRVENLEELLQSGVYATNYGSAAPTLNISHGCNRSSEIVGLNLVFAGESANSGSLQNLGVGSSYSTIISFCDASTGQTNCVNFDSRFDTYSPGSSKTLVLSTSPGQLIVAYSNACAVDLWSSSPTPLEAFNRAPKIEALNTQPLTTQYTYVNGATLYWTHPISSCSS